MIINYRNLSGYNYKALNLFILFLNFNFVLNDENNF